MSLLDTVETGIKVPTLKINERPYIQFVDPLKGAE